MSTKLKPFKTYEEQLSILKSRGLRVEDEASAIDALSNLNYYRLSGYTFMRMNRQTNRFNKGTTFDQICHLYAFDKELRHLIMPLVERIEIAVRCRLAYTFSEAHFDEKAYPDNDAHYDYSNFIDLNSHVRLFTDIIPKKIENDKSTPFVRQHIKNYNSRMPLWAIVELLSFTNLSILYSILKSDDRKSIAKGMGVKDHYLGNWLDVLVVLRNKCAHHARLYGVTFSPPVLLPDAVKHSNPTVKNQSLFSVIYIALRLVPDRSYRNEFINDLEALIKTHKDCILIEEMGFPVNWKTVLNNIAI